MRSNFAICRGKRRDTDEWVTGYFRYYNKCSFIDTIPVYPDTVGRLLEYAAYDSFEDNPKIFQGDIIGIWDRHEDIQSVPCSRSGVVLDENSIIEGICKGNGGVLVEIYDGSSFYSRTLHGLL